MISHQKIYTSAETKLSTYNLTTQYPQKIQKNQGFPGGSVGKNLPANVRDAGSIPGSGRSPGEGNGNPLQYSRLENSMDRGAWWTTIHEVAKRWTHD